MESTKVDSSCSASESESELNSSISAHSEVSCPLYFLFLLVLCSLPSIHFDSVVAHCQQKNLWIRCGCIKTPLRTGSRCASFSTIRSPTRGAPSIASWRYPLRSIKRATPISATRAFCTMPNENLAVPKGSLINKSFS